MNDQANAIPSLEVHLLGKFAVIYKGELVPALNTPRLQSLLAYLALHSDAPQSRKALAFRLWPESNEEQALTNLRKQLKFLRDALPNADHLLVGDRQTVGWVDPSAIYCDVTEFHKLLSPSTTPNHSLATLKRALDLYQGELLPGCYDEWLLPEREELQQIYLSAIERLSTLHEGERNYNDAIQASLQLLRIDPLHEATYRRLIRLYALNEDRASALRTYHTCVTQLREELGVDPDEETQAVYERLLNGAALTSVQHELAAYAPFVGRQAEWQRLQDRWKLAMRGTPQLALIAGEAGIGKTRLAEEMLSWATHQGFCTVRSRCYAAEGRLTYAPIIEWLRTEPIRQQRNKLAPPWRTELSRLLPEVLSENPTLPAPEPITQSAQRHHLFEAATRALLAGEQPLLLLIDDLQWCDKETLELLHFLLRNATTLGHSKLMLIGTARLPDEVDANHPLYELLNPLRVSGSLTQLDLKRLTAAETNQLATQMAEQQLDEHALKQLFADTDGNPLFVVETMRATDIQFTHNGSPDSSVILSINANQEILQHMPPKVLAVIQSRLAQLSPIARELCEWAATIGRSFTFDLLSAASKITPDKAVNALDELWQRRIIREHGSDAYDFSHDRIRDVVVAGVSRVRGKYLHRCVAEASEELSAGQLDNIAAHIAAHFEAAGVSERAIHYYRLAAEASLRIYANREAIEFLERALTLLRRQIRNKINAEHEYQLLLMMGPPLVATQGFGSKQLHDYYLTARSLELEQNYPPDPAVIRILAIYYLTHRNFDLVHQLGTELLTSAKSASNSGDTLLLVEGYYTLGVASFWQGHFRQSRHYLEQGVIAYDPKHHALHVARFGQDPGVVCSGRLAWTLWYLGFPEQARREIRHSLSLAKTLQHPFTFDYLFMIMQWLVYDTADQLLAAELEEQLSIFQSKYELSPSIQAMRLVFQGYKHVTEGHCHEGLSMIYEGIGIAIANKYDLMFKLHFQATLAQAFLQSGSVNQANEAIDLAVAHTITYGDHYYLAELHRLKGEIYLTNSKTFERAEECFNQALAIARSQEAKSLELRAAISLARLWNQQDKRYEAQGLLISAYGWFTEGFDTVDLREAKALLSQ